MQGKKRYDDEDEPITSVDLGSFASDGQEGSDWVTYGTFRGGPLDGHSKIVPNPVDLFYIAVDPGGTTGRYLYKKEGSYYELRGRLDSDDPEDLEGR